MPWGKGGSTERFLVVNSSLPARLWQQEERPWVGRAVPATGWGTGNRGHIGQGRKALAVGLKQNYFVSVRSPGAQLCC